MNLQTTLNIIRAAKPCADGWAKLLKSLPADHDHDTPIAFSHILESNDLNDALWALRSVMPAQEEERDREARLFACDCAENVLPIFEKRYPEDIRPRKCVEVARRLANGQATTAELEAARAAAGYAAWAAAWAARAAAAASRADAWFAALAAAGDAAWAAAEEDAERAKQKVQFVARFCSQEVSK